MRLTRNEIEDFENWSDEKWGGVLLSDNIEVYPNYKTAVEKKERANPNFKQIADKIRATWERTKKH